MATTMKCKKCKKPFIRLKGHRGYYVHCCPNPEHRSEHAKALIKEEESDGV